MKILFVLILGFYFNDSTIKAQSGRTLLTESAPDSLKFSSYIDSIEKYLYMDSNISIEYFQLCEEMIYSNSLLSSNNKIDYVIQSIYLKYLEDDAIGAYELIENNRHLSHQAGIKQRSINLFDYLDGFTSFSLGDHESAQEIYQKLLEQGLATSDSSLIYQASHSLGTINREQEYQADAQKYLLQSLNYIKTSPNRTVHAYYDLIESYLAVGDLKNAKDYNIKAIQLADSLGLSVFHFDLLRQRVQISIAQNDLSLSEQYHQKALSIAKDLNNESNIEKCMESMASILIAKSQSSQALKIYEELISSQNVKNHNPSTLLRYYKQAHNLANKVNLMDEAYTYLMLYNKIQDSLSVEEQHQKVQYLNIKFDVEQKVKANELLTAKVSEKKAQNNFLIALSLLFITLMIGMYRSIAKKKQFNRELQQVVTERTTELRTTNSSLKKSNLELSHFNNILSHDLKEPIRSIVGFSQLANKGLNNKEYESLSDYLTLIQSNGKRLNQLIDDVNVFHTATSKPSSPFSDVNIQEIINALKVSLSSLVDTKNAQITCDEMPVIKFDEKALGISLKHLIHNGIKFNENEKPVVHVSYDQDNSAHILFIKDNGIGINSKFFSKIFTMFGRFNTRHEYEGSGLGLSMSKKLIENAGGSINIVSSVVNKGTTFNIRIPKQD